MEGVHEEGGAADEGAGYRHGSANVKVQVLVHNLRKDIQAAGGSVDVEENGLRGA